MAKGPGLRGHSRCRKGETVIVKTLDGQTIIDKFVERKGSKAVILEEYGLIPKSNIRLFAIYKKKHHVRKN